MRVATFRGTRFYGLRIGRWYVQVKDLRVHRALFSERNKIGLKHVTLGHWRIVLMGFKTGRSG